MEFGAQIELLGEFAQSGDIGVGAPRGRERRRVGLEALADFEQFGEERVGHSRLQAPGENVGVEHVPVTLIEHARADLGPRGDHALCRQGLQGFAKGCVGDREINHQLFFRGKQRTDGIDSVDDAHADAAQRRVVSRPPAPHRLRGTVTLFSRGAFSAFSTLDKFGASDRRSLAFAGGRRIFIWPSAPKHRRRARCGI